MSIDTLKSDIYSVGAEDINDAAAVSAWLATLRLKDAYNVTFEDPSKPSGSAYKRVQFLEGDEFALIGARRTKANLVIFQMKPFGIYAEERASRWSSGPGLSKPLEIAEFTVKSINDERMNGSEFLKAVLDLVEGSGKPSRNAATVEIDRGTLWGSW
ncbi:MAG: hypothetical protein LPK02_07340 [Rhodobacterales bacterium]|nr:hypothetical protein [Rhodobacterales bacterium]